MLLDTHVWIWLVNGDRARLGPRTARRLAAATGDRAASVSAVSAFEVAALHVEGRLTLSLPVERWIRESIARAGFRTVDLDSRIGIDAGLIPANALPDPFDRCLVATAREYALSLVTRDRRILDYARRTKLVTVIDAAA